MTDPYPNIDEFGLGAPYCSGSAVGCAICVCADGLLRAGKSIPRLPDGTPNLILLGDRMGSKCRAASGSKHGLALQGVCTGGKWCSLCITLQWRNAGLSVLHQPTTWNQIDANARLKRPQAVPITYGKIPYVSPSSYSSTIPARGRSDSFTGGHMILLWSVASRNSAGASTSYVVSDPDFGSPRRPIVPPHSVLSASAVRAGWEAFGSNPVAVLTSTLPDLNPPTYKVRIHPAAGQRYRYFWIYRVVNGVITGRERVRTGGMSADCTAPRIYRWPGIGDYALVRLTSGARKGQYVASTFARKV